MFIKDEASTSLAADKGRTQPKFGTSSSARQTAQPDTSDTNLSVVLTASSRSVSTLPGVPGQPAQKPSIQVCSFHKIHISYCPGFTSVF